MWHPRPLPRRFFARHSVVVARALIGHLLVHQTADGLTIGRIVEAEAYGGADDGASHARRRTARSAIMFGPPGVAYVYLSYGVHWCLNVVTEEQGTPGAVLLRALEPVEGAALMRCRVPAAPPARVASGPGRLTRAMAVWGIHNGADLTRPPLYIADGAPGRRPLVVGPRIGVSRAADRPWRFGLAGSRALSRPFPARRL
ncbi:MAG: DNA-3-methyladenine glycosylase [Armatimonadota bacterium]|nr:DNA-3-methyladenine glycosylase [Armatimonadota bacterium]